MEKSVELPLRRDFGTRGEMALYLASQFPHAEGDLSPILGGRSVADRKLASFRASEYVGTRNFLNGTVSRLSPYLRHGVIRLANVRRSVSASLTKFIQELAWRDYYQRVYFQIGDAVWSDREEYKTGIPASGYKAEVPADVVEGRTGLACIDAFTADLQADGYLHNHARMWFAAYLVHWRRIRWQAGAKFFLRHLLDGDPASNNLSWQWVASTFSNKPYIFNRENLERYTAGEFCADCPSRNKCPFDATYEELSERLFKID